MALQEDDQLWEHLQGKSREELLGLLEQITHHSRKRIGKSGILWHTGGHGRRSVDNNRTYG